MVRNMLFIAHHGLPHASIFFYFAKHLLMEFIGNSTMGLATGAGYMGQVLSYQSGIHTFSHTHTNFSVGG